MLKQEHNQSITQTYEYRVETLSVIPGIVAESFDVTTMSDIRFNDLIYRLEVLQKDKDEKEKQLELKKQADNDEEARIKTEAEILEKKNQARMKKEESIRRRQAKEAAKNENNINMKKVALEKSFIDKREEANSKIKTHEQVIKEDIEKLNSLITESIDSIPKKEAKPVKKKGRPKKKVEE